MGDLKVLSHRPLDADQICYALWRESGERLPVQESAAFIRAQLEWAYRRGRRTEARKRQRRI